MSATRRPPVWAFISLAWLGPAILAAFQAYVQGRLGNRDPATWRALVWEGGDWLLYAMLTPAVFWVARRYPLTRGNVLRRAPLHLLAATGFCALWAAGGVALGWVVFGDASASTGPGLVSWFFTSLPFGVAVYFAVLGVEHAAFYFVEARDGDARAARLSAQLADSRLAALRMQLQPHFLFNSLNALAVVLRDRDVDTATHMVEQLGEMLRRVQRTDGPSEVPLAMELDFVRRYLAVEKVRFPDRLRPEFAIGPGLLTAAVPEFLLQPLVENALRHGLAKRLAATRLEIGARREGEDLVLTVADDGPGPDGAASGDGVGLGNTRERLATLYGGRARLDLEATPDGGATATVRLPYRTLSE